MQDAWTNAKDYSSEEECNILSALNVSLFLSRLDHAEALKGLYDKYRTESSNPKS